MSSYRLDAEQIVELRLAHRRVRDAALADRIKAVVLLGSGWKPVKVAEALLIDERTVRTYFQKFQSEGVDGLLFRAYVGKEPYLTPERQAELAEYLDANLISTVKEIVAYVFDAFAVRYSLGGMTKLVRRLNFVYKKTTHVPAKADDKAQREFVKKYRRLRRTSRGSDEIYFIDGCHPTHNSVPTYAWIRKGETKELKANPGRRRLNINGALNVKSRSLEVVYFESVNSQSTIELFDRLESLHPRAKRIIVVADNARYYHSRLIQEYLKTSRIQIIFLPPYLPNLNLIERVWKFFKKKVTNNSYYETYDSFLQACSNFFQRWKTFDAELRALLTENFQIVNTT